MATKRARVARLQQELLILSRYFPSFKWKIREKILFVEGDVLTNSRSAYTLRVELSSDFPNSLPKMYIVRPKPLLACGGIELATMGADPDMHTLRPKDGAVCICHFHPSHWGPEQTLYKVVLKGRIWLEALEGHRKTGLPLDNYLAHQD